MTMVSDKVLPALILIPCRLSELKPARSKRSEYSPSGRASNLKVPSFAVVVEADVSRLAMQPKASLPPTLKTRCVASGGIRVTCCDTIADVSPSTASKLAFQFDGIRCLN